MANYEHLQFDTNPVIDLTVPTLKRSTNKNHDKKKLETTEVLRTIASICASQEQNAGALVARDKNPHRSLFGYQPKTGYYVPAPNPVYKRTKPSSRSFDSFGLKLAVSSPVLTRILASVFTAFHFFLCSSRKKRRRKVSPIWTSKVS
jgi:hypothetical protein